MQKLGGVRSNDSGKSTLGKSTDDRSGKVGKPVTKRPLVSMNSRLGSEKKIEDAMGNENAPVVGAANPEESTSTYFGKISPQNLSKNSESIIETLKDLNLFYVGDGVKLPLTIRLLDDGSFGLSISKSICEAVIQEECPCYASGKGLKGPSKDAPEKLHFRKRRSLERQRPFVVPVEEFAKKYSLKLNLTQGMALINKGIGKVIHSLDEAYDLTSSAPPKIKNPGKKNDKEWNSSVLKRFGFGDDDEQYGSYEYQRQFNKSWKDKMETMKNFYKWLEEFVGRHTDDRIKL